jgi:glutamyl-tRNA synthetase
MAPAALRALLAPLWLAEGWQASEAASPSGEAWETELAALLGPSLVTLRDGVEQARPFFQRPEPDASALHQLQADGSAPSLAALLERLPAAGTLEPATAQALLGEAAAAAAVKKGVLMKSLRAALLGSLQGPDLVSTWRLLHAHGEDRIRLERSLAP